MFSPDFLTQAAAGHYRQWWLDGNLVHHRDHTGKHFVWKLTDEKRQGWTLGVWPD
jgi:hypothetical protein